MLAQLIEMTDLITRLSAAIEGIGDRMDRIEERVEVSERLLGYEDRGGWENFVDDHPELKG